MTDSKHFVDFKKLSNSTDCCYCLVSVKLTKFLVRLQEYVFVQLLLGSVWVHESALVLRVNQSYKVVRCCKSVKKKMM